MLLLAPRAARPWETFNAVPDIRDAYKQFKQLGGVKLVAELGELFLRHGVNNDFGLVVNHKHFQLKEEELLVEVMNKERTLTVAMPWILKDGVVTPSENESSSCAKYDLVTAQPYAVAQSWYFSQDGELVPYEYFSTEEETLPEVPADFASQLYQSLKARNSVGIVGIKRIDASKEVGTFEVTAPGSRVSVTGIGFMPEGGNRDHTERVFFYFGENGEPLSESGMWCQWHNGCDTDYCDY